MIKFVQNMNDRQTKRQDVWFVGRCLVAEEKAVRFGSNNGHLIYVYVLFKVFKERVSL